MSGRKGVKPHIFRWMGQWRWVTNYSPESMWLPWERWMALRQYVRDMDMRNPV